MEAVIRIKKHIERNNFGGKLSINIKRTILWRECKDGDFVFYVGDSCDALIKISEAQAIRFARKALIGGNYMKEIAILELLTQSVLDHK